MPEVVLSAIPPLQISPDNSSEADSVAVSAASGTDRSSSSLNVSRPLRTLKNGRPSTGFQTRNKPRKSNTKRLSKKVTPNSNNSQQKKTTTKSHIPRSVLLTPSSSSTSLSPAGSFRPPPLTPVNRAITTEEKTVTAVLQRQKTGIILAYRERKSISQMDLKHFRRHVQFPHPARDVTYSGVHDKSLLVEDQNYSFSNHDTTVVHKMSNYNGFAYDTAERESRMAGMKIFATIMLNAWRKRRDEVKRLLGEVAELKRGAIKARNQLHVFNTLFRVEQKRNDELNCQLKHSIDDINSTKSSCESLTTSLISLKADKALLEQQNQMKDQEIESLNSVLSQTKTELFKIMTIHRELQADLSVEQRNVQSLENQKNELISEIYELNNEAVQFEQQLRTEIDAKTNEIHRTQKDLRHLEEQITQLNEQREQQLFEANTREENLKKQITELEHEVISLNKTLENTFGNRLKSCWYHSLTYSKLSFHILHWLIFYTLPATPPPKPNTFPFGLTLGKVLNIVRR